jgi:hypothetical protein
MSLITQHFSTYRYHWREYYRANKPMCCAGILFTITDFSGRSQANTGKNLLAGFAMSTSECHFGLIELGYSLALLAGTWGDS